MKKLASALSVLALLATMTFGFSSCQQQNQPSQPTQTDPTKTEEPSLVGEWKLLYVEAEGQQISAAQAGMDMTLNFLENGTFFMYETDNISKGSYTLAGKTLIMEGDSGMMKWAIKELTKDMLVLSISLGDGQSADYTFKRV